MAHTRHRRRRHDRALRNEVPSTVAVLGGEDDFQAMSAYSSFVFDDYGSYLQHVDTLLRSLAAQGVHARVALFDPAQFETYCGQEHLDPDLAVSRTLYTAQVAGAGATVPYTGQTVRAILPLLREYRERQLTYEEATRLVAAAERPEVGSHTQSAAFERAAEVVVRLLDALGAGTHHLVSSVSTPGAPLVTTLAVQRTAAEGAAWLEEPDTMLMCLVLAAGFATGRSGGVVTRTTPATNPADTAEREIVRGWCLQRGWLVPLTEAEVFDAYCTHAETGEPIPPESGVGYRAGFILPRPGEDNR